MANHDEMFKNAVEALEYFESHPLWQHYIAYENHVLENYRRAAALGNPANPNYAIAKALDQGKVMGLDQLQQGRAAVKQYVRKQTKEQEHVRSKQTTKSRSNTGFGY